MRIQLIAPMGAAGMRPRSITSTSPQRFVRSDSLSGVNNSGTLTNAHAVATHRGLIFALSASNARTFPTTSPPFTMRIAG